MPLDFPNSPNLNDTYTSGSTTWLWDGTAWVRQVPGVLDNLTDVTLTSSANPVLAEGEIGVVTYASNLLTTNAGFANA